MSDLTEEMVVKKLKEIIKNNTSDGDMLSFVMSTRQALVQLAAIKLWELGEFSSATGDQVDKIFPPTTKKTNGKKKNGKQ